MEIKPRPIVSPVWKCLELARAADGSSVWSMSQQGVERVVRLWWCVEDSCWIAEIVGLKSCSACGETPAEAMRDALLIADAFCAERKRMPGTRGVLAGKWT